jgi:protein phosphatase
VRTIEDLKLAPFHMLASEGAVHIDKDHLWHLETLAELCSEDDLLHPTAHVTVDTTDAESERAGTAWWTELTERGGEGMVVKPLEFLVRGRRGLVQPALKTRGREYLRIIYGPEYTEAANLQRLRGRGLGRKRSLAFREFALGIEALELRPRGAAPPRPRMVFGVLALESEPVDPRL